MPDLIDLIQDYAAERAAAERHHTLAECIDDADGKLTAQAADHDSRATVLHARLLTALDMLTRTTVRAIPDPRLPVSTWRQNLVEVRAVLPDGSRSVRVRYTPEQAVSAGTALIACAAVADRDTGGALTPILPAFPEPTPADAFTAAVDSTEHTELDTDEDPGLAETPDGIGDRQLALPGARLIGALTLISDLEPALDSVLRALNLRVYPGNPALGHLSDYVVLDIHGVSLAAQRRTGQLYLHADTTETADQSIAFEVNGTGEHDHPTR